MSDDRVTDRASHPLPEERPTEAGADRRTQAAALLAESDQRTAQAQTPVAEDGTIEHRTSAEAAD